MALPEHYVTPEDYLKFERLSQDKHEYLDGKIYAMAGASKNHLRIVSSVSAYLYTQLSERPCDVFANDIRVRVNPTGLYTYPDIVVVCEPPLFADNEEDTLLNPTVIIEVLPPSTEGYDRGKKFQHYRTLESLREYLLIAQDTMRIEHYVLHEGKWVLMTDAKERDTVLKLPSIDCTLAVGKVYEKVQFDAGSSQDH
jgi:Uma2 family endonuclease